MDILRFTGETWGQKQLLVYRDKIDKALHAISSNPKIGSRRTDLPETHRAYLVGSHLIVYRHFENNLEIVRILHQRMSLPHHID